MKKFLLIAAMSAVALSTTSAMSSTAGNAQGNTLEVQEVQGRTLLPARAADALYKSVRGEYLMDDGTTLRVFRDNNVTFARVSGDEPVPVAITREGEFVSFDGTVELRFQKNSGGLYDAVVLSKLKQNGIRVVSASRSSAG